MNTKHTTPEQILEQQCLQGNLFSFIDLTDAIDDPRVFQNYLTLELYPGKRPKWSVEKEIQCTKPRKIQKKNRTPLFKWNKLMEHEIKKEQGVFEGLDFFELTETIMGKDFVDLPILTEQESNNIDYEDLIQLFSP